MTNGSSAFGHCRFASVSLGIGAWSLVILQRAASPAKVSMVPEDSSGGVNA
jgi:hypothetical protein